MGSESATDPSRGCKSVEFQARSICWMICPCCAQRVYQYNGWMDDDVVWCAESMTDPSVCVIAQPERPSSPPPPLMMVTMCHNDVATMRLTLPLLRSPLRHHSVMTRSRPRRDSVTCDSCPKHPSSVLASGFGLRRRKSDTLETRTKLTSHSALECGGLPQLPDSLPLHEVRRRPQV